MYTSERIIRKEKPVKEVTKRFWKETIIVCTWPIIFLATRRLHLTAHQGYRKMIPSFSYHNQNGLKNRNSNLTLIATNFGSNISLYHDPITSVLRLPSYTVDLM